MSYSRQQLYAMGEPFGDSATRKEGGRIIYGGGGGGGGAPEKQTQVQDLPDWAKPTAERTIAKTEALTSDKPYQSYANWAQQKGMDPTQVAGFTPMQQQSFEGAQNLRPAAAGQFAQGIAGMAGLSGLNTRYSPFRTGQFTGDTAAGYMSPFIMQSLAPQLREAQRTSEIQRNMDQARAVSQGAFGGGRQAILEAERQRNLGMQLGDIRDKGLQQAFMAGQQQFNTENQLREQSRQFGANIGMQGLQTALQGAGQLGSLGSQEFGQQKDIVGLQSTLGAQQQKLEQDRINAQMAEYSNQQKYPYQQLEFMSNILRGTPMGTVQTLYGASPTLAQQVGALGMGAYGMSRAFAKDGGLMESYAEGGVTSDQNVESILRKLSDAQLAQAKQIALAQRDMERVQMIDDEIAERASLKQGLGGAFNMLPPEEQDSVLEMAGGGIVAMASGGFNPPDPTPLYDAASRLSEQLPGTAYEAPTQEQMRAGILAQRDFIQSMMGDDKLKPFMEDLAAQRAALKSRGERDRGLAALAAVAPMLEGRGLASIGRGISKFGMEVGRLEKEANDAERMLMASQIQIATAQQARADGQFDKANSLFRSGEELREKGLTAKRDILGRQASLQATMAGQALSAQGQKYATDSQARTSRDNANRPSETERILTRIENIMTGKETFAGKSGEEGVKLYRQSLGEVGAAKLGVGEGGMRPGTPATEAALQQAITAAVKADPEHKPLELARMRAEMQADKYRRAGEAIPPNVQNMLDDVARKTEALQKKHEARIRAAASRRVEAAAAPEGAASAAAAPVLRERP